MADYNREPELGEAARRAERGIAATRKEKVTFVTEQTMGRVRMSEIGDGPPDFHATTDDVGRSKFVTTLCGKGLTVNGSQDLKPRAGLCDACAAVIDRDQAPAKEA